MKAFPALITGMKVTDIRCLSGSEIESILMPLAELRIEVFREFPYLYDGTIQYEEDYLSVYIESKQSVVVTAWDEAQLVGASTALPLLDSDVEFQKPFMEHGYDLAQIYYLGESVLSKPYRGQGLGHQFFEHREAAAQQHGFKTTTFCAIERSEHHPEKPQDYRSLDVFWNKRGYQKHDALKAVFNWKEMGSEEEMAHELSFWLRT